MCEGNISFGACIPRIDCQFIMMIPRENRCEFAHSVENCHDFDTMIEYGLYIACNYNEYEYHSYLGLIALLCLVVVYFVVLSCISDFFTPSLCYVSNALGLSESVAGATLLAFGNAAPDLITSMVGAMKMGFEQILAQVLGGGMFLTTVVATAIMFTNPFRLTPPVFFRNLVTYFVAVILLAITYSDRIIHLYEALIFISIYAFYISLFFLQNAQYKKKAHKIIKKVLEAEEREANFTLVRNSSTESVPQESESSDLESDSSEEIFDESRPPKDNVIYSKHRQQLSLEASEAMSELKRMGVNFPTRVVPRAKRTNSLTGYEAVLEVERIQALRAYGRKAKAEQTTRERGHVIAVEIQGERVIEKSRHLFRDFFNNVNPFCGKEWNEDTTFGKFCGVVISPIVLSCKLLVPCVDETIVCNNWCKLLFILQCVYIPPFIMWVLGVHRRTNPEIFIPIFICVTLLGVVISAVIAMTSEVDDPPPYHILVAVTGFIVSIMSIYLIANEVIGIMSTIGRILSISMVTISMTVLPWGNSIGDLVNAITISKAGFPTMAYTGIFGSNLMVILAGVGFSFIVVISEIPGRWWYAMEPKYEGLLYCTFFYLLIGCVSSLLIVPTYNYRMGRSYGVYLVVIYIMFISTCMLTEFNVIYSLGPF